MDIRVAFIGTLCGTLAAFVGGGTEILIVPLLIAFKVFDDYKLAVGTSLASLLLPIGIVAVYFYHNAKCDNNKPCVNWKHALTISLFFVLGTFLAYFTTKMDNKSFKWIFAVILILLGAFILWKH